jgi:hypothetical protein
MCVTRPNSVPRTTGTLDPSPNRPRCAQRTAKVPQRGRTRAENRANYITTERRRNQRTRNAEERRRQESRIIANDEPPPF